MTEFKIEKGIKSTRLKRWPFSDMKIGDSFAIKDLETLMKCRAAAHLHGRVNGKHFSVSKKEMRCWRVS